jgi:hypothetical protein
MAILERATQAVADEDKFEVWALITHADIFILTLRSHLVVHDLHC